MARRKSLFVAVDGRDEGKTFVLTEMPADQAERWANRFILALANTGTKLPENALGAGSAGLAFSMQGVLVMGLQSLQGLRHEVVAPLLDEMLTCVKYQPPGVVGSEFLQKLYQGDECQIEEVKTFWRLRMALFELHLGFSLAGVLSTSESNTSTAPADSNTQTSPEQ